VDAEDPKRLEPPTGGRGAALPRALALRFVMDGGRETERPDPAKREPEAVLRL
jgi:hypothetical protein